MNDGAKQASLGCYRATFTHQYSLCYDTKKPLLPSNSGCKGRLKRLFLYIMRSALKQNPTKTARQISKTDFYFVTGFYRLRDICMRHEDKILLDKKTCFFRRHHCNTILTLLSFSCLIRVVISQRKNNVRHERL